MDKFWWYRSNCVDKTVRYELVGTETTPYFIRRFKYPFSHGQYRLLGSGMGPNGVAKELGWFHTLAEAKARAIELACEVHHG